MSQPVRILQNTTTNNYPGHEIKGVCVEHGDRAKSSYEAEEAANVNGSVK